MWRRRKPAPPESVKPGPLETVAVETVVPGASWVMGWGVTEMGVAHPHPPPGPRLVRAEVAERIVLPGRAAERAESS